MPLVDVPEHGLVEFPDNMSGDQISAAIQKNFPDLSSRRTIESVPLDPYQKADLASMQAGRGKAITGMEPGTEFTTELTGAANKALEYTGNVARGAVADVAATINVLKKPEGESSLLPPSPERIGEIIGKNVSESKDTFGNTKAAILGRPLPIDEAIRESALESGDRGEFPSEATVAKISQGLSATAPLLAIGALPATAQKAILAGFTLKMISDAPDVARQLGEEFGKPESARDPNKISSLVSDAIQITAFAPLGAAGLAKSGKIIGGEKTPLEIKADEIAPVAPLTAEALKQTEKEAPNAIQIKSPNEEVFRTEEQKPEQQLGLQQVDEGNAQPQEPAAAKEETQPLTADQALEKGRGNVTPQELFDMPNEEYRKLVNARDEQGGVQWRLSDDAVAFGVKHGPEIVPELERLKSESMARQMSAIDQGDYSVMDKTQWYGDAIQGATKSGPNYEAYLKREGVPTAEAATEPEPELVGMGGALKEGEPGKPSLGGLTDALKTLAEQQTESAPKEAFNLGKAYAALKDNVSGAVNGLKAAAQYMKLKLEGRPVVTDYKRALGQRHLELSESVHNAKEFAKTSEKAVPDKLIQEAISNWIDTGGDPALLAQAAKETKARYAKGYEAAQKLTPEQVTIAKNIRNYFESRLDDAIDAGILEAGIEDYIHRTYEKESPWKSGALAELGSGVFTGQPGFAKKRVFEYDFEAEKAGYKPIKSFIKRIAAYDLSLNKAIADRKLVKSMMEIKMPDGRPMIDVAGVGVTVPKEGATEATLIKPSVKPSDTDAPINNRGDYKPYDYPALRKWKWVANDANGKPILVQGDVLIHPDAIKDVKTLFEPSAIRKNPVGRAALGLSSVVKQTMLDLSGFHLAQIAVHAMEHRTFKPVKEIDFQNPTVRGLIKGGMQVGDVRGYELFSEGLTGSSLTKHIPVVGEKLQAWNRWLFESYIPRIKTAMAEHAFERNKERFPNLTEEELYHLTANQANAAFGELNYEMLGRSKTTQDMLRLALLAPDFLEARGRFVSQAGTKYGKEQFQALMLGAATLYITARIANKLINDEYHFEPKNAFSVVLGKKAYSLRTVQGDLMHLMTEPGKFAYTRFNPVYGRTLFEFVTGRDYFGRKRTLPEQAKDLASTIVPISARGLLNPREQTLLESFFNSMGVTNRRSTATQTISELVDEFKEKNNIRSGPGEFIYDPDKDPFRNVRQAAMFSDPETVAQEIAATVKKGEVTQEQIKKHFAGYASRPFTGSRGNDAKFFAELSDDNKKIFADAKQERKDLLLQFQKGYRLYLEQKKKEQK